MPDLNEYIQTEDAVQKLNDHVEHMRWMMREGSLKRIKIGRTWLVQRQSLEDYLKRTTEMSKHDQEEPRKRIAPIRGDFVIQ